MASYASAVAQQSISLKPCAHMHVLLQRPRLLHANNDKNARAGLCRHVVLQTRMSRGCLYCKSSLGDPGQEPPPSNSSSATPDFLAGVNWFCYSALGLLFLTDFTPLGSAIQSAQNPGVALALLQWGGFVVPTLYFSRQKGFSLPKTFQLRGCSSAWLAGAAAAGPVLFFIVTGLVQLRLGAVNGASWAGTSSGASPGWGVAGHSLASVLALYVLSPAVAEELLFRGFLLTALRQRLGSVDSVAVSGALFALMHLSVEQFFQFALLGFACGAACVAADSVLPSVILHAGYNLAAVALALRGGS